MDRFRFRAWDKEKKIMYPSWPIWKTYFGDMETWNLILMQCTGLKDKNGKLIYEGDVVRQFVGRPWQGDFVIQWNQGRCGFYMYLFNDPHLELADYRDDLTVIGNIYENPDLIGE